MNSTLLLKVILLSTQTFLGLSIFQKDLLTLILNLSIFLIPITLQAATLETLAYFKIKDSVTAQLAQTFLLTFYM